MTNYGLDGLTESKKNEKSKWAHVVYWQDSLVGRYLPGFKTWCLHLFLDFFSENLGFTHTCAFGGTVDFNLGYACVARVYVRQYCAFSVHWRLERASHSLLCVCTDAYVYACVCVWCECVGLCASKLEAGESLLFSSLCVYKRVLVCVVCGLCAYKLYPIKKE